MNASNLEDKGRPSAAARAQAAVWLTRLHGPNRTREVEAGLRRWMAEDPERAVAFELVTDTWEKSARLRRNPAERATSWDRVGIRISFARAATAIAAVAVVAVLGTLYFFHESGVKTGVGEQRTLVLDDGSRIHLNTSTRVAVRYDDRQRRVELESGEALFEVAKHQSRPFVVVAGDRQVMALGTSFIVRRDAQQLAVTLMEGKVAVSPVEDEVGLAPSGALRTLTPGERLTIGATHRERIDRPAMAKVTAWQRGQIALDSTPLAEAVAEMNRYSRTQILIERPEAARIPVSGIFRAGASADFAQAVGRTYGLRVTEGSDGILLAGAPATPAQEAASADR
jgi:transmembrane sensor